MWSLPDNYARYAKGGRKEKSRRGELQTMKKIVAVLIVLLMILSCFAVVTTFAKQDQTRDKVQERAGRDDTKHADSVTEELSFMEDFRGDLPKATKNQTKERKGKGYDDEEADSLVVELSDTEDFTEDFSGDFPKKSARIAPVVGADPLEIILHPLRCSSVTFEPPASAITVPYNYTKIQQAIDNATDGDTIFVYNGTYNENLTISTNLTLIGENRDSTFIDGMGSNCINVTAADVEIMGFTIHNGSVGIYSEADNVTLTVVSTNISANDHGGMQINAANSIVANVTCNIIVDNNASCSNEKSREMDRPMDKPVGGIGGGIRMYVNASTGTIDATIQDNNIEYNRGGGIRIGRWNTDNDLPWVCGTITALIANNEISNNKDGSIRIKALDTINAIVTDNYIGSVEQKKQVGSSELAGVHQILMYLQLMRSCLATP